MWVSEESDRRAFLPRAPPPSLPRSSLADGAAVELAAGERRVLAGARRLVCLTQAQDIVGLSQAQDTAPAQSDASASCRSARRSPRPLKAVVISQHLVTESQYGTRVSVHRGDPQKRKNGGEWAVAITWILDREARHRLSTYVFLLYLGEGSQYKVGDFKSDTRKRCIRRTGVCRRSSKIAAHFFCKYQSLVHMEQ